MSTAHSFHPLEYRILALAGLPIPASMQGRSLVPLLRGEKPADWPKGGMDDGFELYQPSGIKTVAEAIAASAGK
jgi:hypothetical protein